MKKHLISTFILIAYSAILVKVMVFKDLPTIRIGSLILNFGGTDAGGPPNFLPFKTILPYVLGDKGYIIAGINLVGNIALLVPVGFVAPFGYRYVTWKKSLALGVASGLAIEILQTVLRVGIFDIDDIILNSLGVMSGYWAFMILARWLHTKRYLNIIFTGVLIIAAAAAAFYAVYPQGQPLRVDSGIGVGGVQSGRTNNGESTIPQSGDLCNGTNGTGQIVSVGNKMLTIKLSDGVFKTLNFTDRTTIRTSAGTASKSDLKTGERVTVVVDESETATAVLVCKKTVPENPSGQ